MVPGRPASKHVIGIDFEVRSPKQLGLEIMSSPDEQGVIRVSGIHPKGAVAACGEIKRGDRIIAIGTYDVRTSSHDHVVELLTYFATAEPDEEPKTLYLVVERNEPAPFVTMETVVEYTPNANEKPGFSISSRGSGMEGNQLGPHIIVNIVEGSPVHDAGGVQNGDYIVAVNGRTDIASMVHSEVLALLRNAVNSGDLRISYKRPEGVTHLEGTYSTILIDMAPEDYAKGANSYDERPPIGMEIVKRVGPKADSTAFTVVGVVPDGAAGRAGIVEGDALVSVGKTELKTDFSVSDVEELFQDCGTIVVVKVMHPKDDDRIETDKTRVVTLRRTDEAGQIGIKLSHPEAGSAPRVSGIIPGCPAARFGHAIRFGDEITSVNSQRTRALAMDKINELFADPSADRFTLELQENTTPVENVGRVLDTATGLRTKMIRLTRRSDGHNFGLHVGSVGTPGQPLVVQCVEPGSAADDARPAKIEQGDVIAMVNKTYILGLGATHEDVSKMMRKSWMLELTLIAGAGFDKVKMVTIDKEAGGAAGLEIGTSGTSPDGKGYTHRVTKVVPGTPAYYASLQSAHPIEYGDRVLMINGVPVSDVSHYHIQPLLSTEASVVVLLRTDTTDMDIHKQNMTNIAHEVPESKKDVTVWAWESKMVEKTKSKDKKKIAVPTGGIRLYKQPGRPGIRAQPGLNGQLSTKTIKLAPTLKPHDILLAVKVNKKMESVLGWELEDVQSLLRNSKTKKIKAQFISGDTFDMKVLNRRTVSLKRDAEGESWGMQLEGRSEGSRVRSVAAGSPAANTGAVHPGDDIVTVNGEGVWHKKSKEIEEMFKDAEESILLEVQDHFSLVEDDVVAEPFRRRVCLARGDLGLGIEVWGDEAPFQISNVVDGKVAARSKNVFIQDVIVEVNGKPVKGLTHDNVIDLIQEEDPVEFLLQTNGDVVEVGPDLSHIKDVTLVKPTPGASLGLVVEDRGSIRVVGKIPGTIGAADQNILIGDQIVAVNGIDLTGQPQAVLNAEIKKSDTVNLKLAPNPDPYERVVEIPNEPNYLDVETIALEGGDFEHRLVDVRAEEDRAGPNSWWDTRRTLMYHGDTIECVGDDEARFFDEKKLHTMMQSTQKGEPVVLVMRTDFTTINDAEINGGALHGHSSA